MIILEGPDGGGKTTLLRELAEFYPSIPVHSRASDGVKGPVPNLYDWAHDDVWTWHAQPLSFYDRHPLISEYIYGPLVRGTMDPRFHATPLLRRLTRHALVIVCLPPLDAVRASVSASRDMPGVTTHIDAIWHLYASLRASWPSCISGLIYHDYTEARDLSMVHTAIRAHRTDWEAHYA